MTDKFPELQQAAKAIRVPSAILDCEGVCIGDGRSVFDDFQHRGRLADPRRTARAATQYPATFVAFDVIFTGHDHTSESLTERKRRLDAIVNPNESLICTPRVEGNGLALKKMTEERNWEGIVARRKDSRYTFDVRSPEWIKIKNRRTIDTVILGYALEPRFALVVGLHFPTMQNKPVAVVEYGFTPSEKQAFKSVACEIHTVKSKGIQWVEPRICCRIRYLERTDNPPSTNGDV